MLTTMTTFDSVTKQPDVDRFDAPVIPSLSFSCKIQEYSTMKKVLIPINKLECSGGRFQSADDAVQFILQHCIKYYNTTKRNMVNKYAEQVSVIDVSRGAYIPLSSIPAREFNRVYNKVAKRMINKISK